MTAERPAFADLFWAAVRIVAGLAVVGWAIAFSVVTYLLFGEAGELFGPRRAGLYFSWLPVGLGLVTFHLGRRLLERVNQPGAFAPTAVAATLMCALTTGFIDRAYPFAELARPVIAIGTVLIVAAIQARIQGQSPATGMHSLRDARGLRLAGVTLLVGWGGALTVAAILMLALLDPPAYFMGSAGLLVMAGISIWYAAGLVRDEPAVLRIAAAGAGAVPAALLVILAGIELGLALVVVTLAATLAIAATVTLRRELSTP